MFGTSSSETDLLLLHAPSVYDFPQAGHPVWPGQRHGPLLDRVRDVSARIPDDSQLPPRSRPARADRQSRVAHDEQPAFRRAPLPRAPEAQGRRDRPALVAPCPWGTGSGAHRKRVASGRAGHHGRPVVDVLSPRVDRLPTGGLRLPRRQHRAAATTSCSSPSRRASRSTTFRISPGRMPGGFTSIPCRSYR